jgi:hypothetical protein
MNYLSPGVRSGPWSKYEDELLVAKINEVGRAWSTFTRYFSGRSESDIKNRWYSHLKYQTVAFGKNIRIVSDASALPDRKKRKRAERHPKENAIKLLVARPQAPNPPREPEIPLELDIWDRFLPDEVVGQDYSAEFDFF